MQTVLAGLTQFNVEVYRLRITAHTLISAVIVNIYTSFDYLVFFANDVYLGKTDPVLVT